MDSSKAKLSHSMLQQTAGAAKHSFVSALLDSEIKLPYSAVGEEDDVVSWAAATMYGGTYTRHMSEGKTHRTLSCWRDHAGDITQLYTSHDAE